MKTHRLINPNALNVTAIQSRQHTSLELIEDYAAQMDAGVQFDPCCAVETPDLNQPVRHLTGFVPAEVQISTQKSLALTPQPNQEDSVANTPRQEAAEEEDAFEARLERCRACVGKHYLVKIEGVLGVTHITEVNEYLAIVRGVTYPYDANNPFPNFACGTFNFGLEDLLTGVKGYGCQYCERLSTIAGAKELTEQPVIDHPLLMCSFCLGDFQQEHLYSRDTKIAICQKCATDALVALQKLAMQANWPTTSKHIVTRK